MHTTALTSADSNGEWWVVIHNSDWSGEASLRKLRIHPTGLPSILMRETKLPGEVLLHIAEAIIESRDDAIKEAVSRAIRGET